MTHKERKEEVREILALDTDELVKRAKGQLILFPTLDEVYDYLAEEMVKEFAKAARGKKIVNFIMDLRWAYCLQNGLPLDMDVYDLAASSCLCELTEKSVRSRSKTMDVPDFTRGGWSKTKSQGILQCDMSKLNFKSASKDDAALNV